MNLSNVTILITSFLRPGYLTDCLAGIKKNLPECQVVVVDDGDAKGDDIISMPFDSGLSAKRNVGVAATHTTYLLMGSDDFDFSTKEARDGIEKMVGLLDADSTIDIAGGHVNGEVYEGNLFVAPGQYIAQSRVSPLPSGVSPCDLVVNYFVARTESIRPFPWDERMKIGGEHGDWFLTLRDNGKKVVAISGVNITTLPHNASKEDPRYSAFRARAKNLGHKIFLHKRGVSHFYSAGEATPEPLKLPKFMVAIVACHKNQAKIDELRKVWVPSLYKIDYRIFYGRGATRKPLPDEVFLDVNDDYLSLPAKMKEIYRWVVNQGYEYVFKVDDDVYVEVSRLIPCGWQKYEYSGRVNYAGKAPYASGACYWLSKRAMQLIVNEPLGEDTAEDRWVGFTLHQHGVNLYDESRYNLVVYLNRPPAWQTDITSCICTTGVTIADLAKGFAEGDSDVFIKPKLPQVPKQPAFTAVPSRPEPPSPLPRPQPPLNWNRFLDKKVQTLFQKFRYVVVTEPKSSHYKSLCSIYPDHLEEVVNTPQGSKLIFIVNKEQMNEKIG